MEALKLIRKERKLRQQDLADYLRITVSAYGNYELGQREPDLSTLCKLSDYFDVSVDYLIGNTDDPRKASAWTKEEKAAGVGAHGTKLSNEEWEIIELFSELKRVKGEKAANAVKTMIKALLEEK